jgi:hypothetical protein
MKAQDTMTTPMIRAAKWRSRFTVLLLETMLFADMAALEQTWM